MIYGLKGWYWKMPSGRLGVIQAKTETLSYTDASNEPELCRLLQVDLSLQEELAEFHDSKARAIPKSAPLSSRRYRGNLVLKPEGVYPSLSVKPYSCK